MYNMGICFNIVNDEIDCNGYVRNIMRCCIEIYKKIYAEYCSLYSIIDNSDANCWEYVEPSKLNSRKELFQTTCLCFAGRSNNATGIHPTNMLCIHCCSFWVGADKGEKQKKWMYLDMSYAKH